MGARDGRISRCGSGRRRSTRSGPGPKPSFTCTSPKRRCGPGPGWPGSTTSGPCLLSRLRQVLGTRCQIQLKPVINLNDEPAPVDSYEIPARIAEHLRLRQPMDVFPHAAGGSRRTDLDHTTPYLHPQRGGPPGQTAVGNLGPLVRYHHRVKTHAAVERATTRGWQLDLARPHRTHLPGQHQRHPPARQIGVRPTDLARRELAAGADREKSSRRSRQDFPRRLHPDRLTGIPKSLD